NAPQIFPGQQCAKAGIQGVENWPLRCEPRDASPGSPPPRTAVRDKFARRLQVLDAVAESALRAAPDLNSSFPRRRTAVRERLVIRVQVLDAIGESAP